MLGALLTALESSALAEWMRLSSVAYPLVNTLHVVGIALLFGSILPLDLRLAGWRRQAVSIDALSAVLLPVAISGLLLAAATGALLFTTDAQAYAASPVFQAKLALIAAALVNVWLLRRTDWRRQSEGSRRLALAGTASILLWLGVITLGRWIAYA